MVRFTKRQFIEESLGQGMRKLAFFQSVSSEAYPSSAHESNKPETIKRKDNTEYINININQIISNGF